MLITEVKTIEDFLEELKQVAGRGDMLYRNIVRFHLRRQEATNIDILPTKRPEFITVIASFAVKNFDVGDSVPVEIVRAVLPIGESFKRFECETMSKARSIRRQIKKVVDDHESVRFLNGEYKGGF